MTAALWLIGGLQVAAVFAACMSTLYTRRCKQSHKLIMQYAELYEAWRSRDREMNWKLIEALKARDYDEMERIVYSQQKNYEGYRQQCEELEK